MQKIHNKFLSLLTLSIALLAGCAQQAAVHPQDAEDGLQSRQSGLDRVSAAFAFDLSGARVYLEPVTVAYRKRSLDLGSPLRAEDYELDEKDMARLQELMGEVLSERFLTPRQSELVADKAEADYVMQLDLSRFSLGAPLDPQPWMWRVYTDQSAYGVLSGELLDRDGNAVMRFSDRRDIGENFGSLGPGGRFERFTSITFWNDMKVDMRRAFASLDKSLQ
ncbi:hypothetical protein PVT68_14675 [Microbulbifer bruguierae]|uniref:DUF3313 domain-containing protein n=1 Tax=Microbulbifer bruguierae TaxID=3029061 RepID=A0ABY8NE22_9GAMM|nr:hypothetical protein [Microbulbifer bruguierae]WGL16007.1 hypothetical protein PVT68_14675 [Microbulbifer bruguierae]